MLNNCLSPIEVRILNTNFPQLQSNELLVKYDKTNH